MASVKFYKNDIAYPKVLADKLNKLADMPDAMEFKGSLGVGGTITALPVDGSAKKGDTYKVITDGTYAGQTAKVGDLFICNGKTASSNTWVYIPSGDEPSGTVTSVKIEANAPISVNDSTPITSSGTRTISHNTSGVGAGTYGPTADVTGTNDTILSVPKITVDTYGHITSIENKTYTSKDTHNSHALTITNGEATSQSQGTTITYVESVSGCSSTSGNLSGSTVRKSITVPANTDYQVQQSSIITNAEYCLLAKSISGTGNATVTSTTIFATGITINPAENSIYCTGAYYASSDERKKDIVNQISLEKAYELVDKCQTILYTWKNDVNKQIQIGLLAQEVQQYFPELVSEGGDGYLTLDYSKLTVILLTVIRDLTRKMNNIEDRLKSLENKLK